MAKEGILKYSNLILEKLQTALKNIENTINGKEVEPKKKNNNAIDELFGYVYGTTTTEKIKKPSKKTSSVNKVVKKTNKPKNTQVSKTANVNKTTKNTTKTKSTQVSKTKNTTSVNKTTKKPTTKTTTQKKSTTKPSKKTTTKTKSTTKPKTKNTK